MDFFRGGETGHNLYQTHAPAFALPLLSLLSLPGCGFYPCSFLFGCFQAATAWRGNHTPAPVLPSRARHHRRAVDSYPCAVLRIVSVLVLVLVWFDFRFFFIIIIIRSSGGLVKINLELIISIRFVFRRRGVSICSVCVCLLLFSAATS